LQDNEFACRRFEQRRELVYIQVVNTSLPVQERASPAQANQILAGVAGQPVAPALHESCLGAQIGGCIE
jgi:hypothetical protein